MNAPTTDTVTSAEQEALTDALAGLEMLDEIAEGEIVEEIDDLDDLETVNEIEELEVVSETDVLEDGALDELELELDKAEAYANQESEVSVESTDAEEVKTAKTGKAAGSRVRTHGAAPRTPRDLNAVAPEHFVLVGDVSSMDAAAIDAAKAAALANRPAQVKVAEKYEGVFQSMAAGRAPSKYVTQAFEVLAAKKEVTLTELVGAYKAAGLGEGTARSQAGQMMVLFPATGVATKSGKTLKLDDESNVAAYLRKHIAA